MRQLLHLVISVSRKALLPHGLLCAACWLDVTTLRATLTATLCTAVCRCVQMYGFGLVSCVVDNAKSSVQAQMGDLGWTTVSLEQLQQEHERRLAAKQKGGRK